MTDRWTRSAELMNQRGLHARASAAFAREASKYNARVTVRYDGMSASAASIMDLLMLGAHVGQTVEIALQLALRLCLRVKVGRRWGIQHAHRTHRDWSDFSRDS